MTDINYTHITLVVDRSGSMNGIRVDAQGGIDTFLREQAALGIGDRKIRSTLTLVEFDDIYNVVHDFTNLKGADLSYRLVPRGSTALLDAMGKAATITGESLKALPANKRPGQVYFVVMTDGGENASREWKKDQVTALLKTNQDVYQWQVIYLSADINAIYDAQAYGVAGTATLASTYDNYSRGIDVTNNSILNSRRMTYAGGQSVTAAFTVQEQEDALDDSKTTSSSTS